MKALKGKKAYKKFFSSEKSEIHHISPTKTYKRKRELSDFRGP